jgi:hypothetical protein
MAMGKIGSGPLVDGVVDGGCGLEFSVTGGRLIGEEGMAVASPRALALPEATESATLVVVGSCGERLHSLTD